MGCLSKKWLKIGPTTGSKLILDFKLRPKKSIELTPLNHPSDQVLIMSSSLPCEAALLPTHMRIRFRSFYCSGGTRTYLWNRFCGDQKTPPICLPRDFPPSSHTPKLLLPTVGCCFVVVFFIVVTIILVVFVVVVIVIVIVIVISSSSLSLVSSSLIVANSWLLHCRRRLHRHPRRHLPGYFRSCGHRHRRSRVRSHHSSKSQKNSSLWPFLHSLIDNRRNWMKLRHGDVDHDVWMGHAHPAATNRGP